MKPHGREIAGQPLTSNGEVLRTAGKISSACGSEIAAWRDGERRRDQHVHRVKPFFGRSADLREVAAPLNVSGGSHVSACSNSLQSQWLVKFRSFGDVFAVVRISFGGPDDVS